MILIRNRERNGTFLKNAFWMMLQAQVWKKSQEAPTARIARNQTPKREMFARMAVESDPPDEEEEQGDADGDEEGLGPLSGQFQAHDRSLRPVLSRGPRSRDSALATAFSSSTSIQYRPPISMTRAFPGRGQDLQSLPRG